MIPKKNGGNFGKRIYLNIGMSDEKINENISDLLNTDFESDENSQSQTVIIQPKVDTTAIDKTVEKRNKDIEEDYALARQLNHEAIDCAMQALRNMKQLSSQMEKGSFFDSLANILDKVEKLSNNTLDLHNKKDSLNHVLDDNSSNDINIDKAIVYTGNLADMQRELLKDNKQNDDGKSEE